MTVILFIAVIVTHILKYGKGSYSEGMENNDATTNNTKTDTETAVTKSVNVDIDEIIADNKSATVDDPLQKITKVKEMTQKILDIDKNGIDPEKKKEITKDLGDMKDMRNKIVEQVKNMQPMIQDFYGVVEKMKNHTDGFKAGSK